MKPDQAHTAVIAVGNPIATRTEGWSWGSTGIWLFDLTGTPGVVVALFKTYPALKKLGNEREATTDGSNLAGFKAVVAAQAAKMVCLM